MHTINTLPASLVEAGRSVLLLSEGHAGVKLHPPACYLSPTYEAQNEAYLGAECGLWCKYTPSSEMADRLLKAYTHRCVRKARGYMVLVDAQDCLPVNLNLSITSGMK